MRAIEGHVHCCTDARRLGDGDQGGLALLGLCSCQKKVENAETLESSIQYSAALNTFSNTTSHYRLHHMNRFICKSLGLVLLFQRAGMVRAELARGDWWNNSQNQLDFLLVGPLKKKQHAPQVQHEATVLVTSCGALFPHLF